MMYAFMAVFAVVIVVADQLSKSWTVHHIAANICHIEGVNCAEHIAKLQEVYSIPAQTDLPGSVPAVDGVFKLSHVHNTGAAWSSFQGQIWLFILIFAVFAAFIIWEFSTKKMGFKTFERWCLVAVFAGAVGNIIDRIRLGFVIDMIHLEFMEFPVFNVADSFICCGCIALMVHLVFCNKEFWKDSKKKQPGQEEAPREIEEEQ